jgi:hypothetical protein
VHVAKATAGWVYRLGFKSINMTFLVLRDGNKLFARAIIAEFSGLLNCSIAVCDRRRHRFAIVLQLIFA